MTPVWMIEGGATALEGDMATSGQSNGFRDGNAVGEPAGDLVSERNLAERRLAALASAIREHESRRRHQAVPARPEDLTLYRRLRQVCGER
jgi:hypothetical protein